MSKKDELLRAAESELGYIEKSRAAYNLVGPDCLYAKKDYAGSDNLTKFAVEASHPQGQPWCQTFVAALLIRVFGREIANKLLCGKISSASTMEVKNAMVAAGRQVPIAEAQAGDIAYRSRSGGGHVGLVAGWKNGKLVTIEGNTSSTDSSSWNGGEVAEHVGASWMWVVRPDYAIAGMHWVFSGGKWYYQDADGRNSRGWQLIRETDGVASHWYYFDSKGAAVTGMQIIDCERYYFEESGPLCCALNNTNDVGALSVWFL